MTVVAVGRVYQCPRDQRGGYDCTYCTSMWYCRSESNIVVRYSPGLSEGTLKFHNSQVETIPPELDRTFL